LKEGLIINIIR